MILRRMNPDASVGRMNPDASVGRTNPDASVGRTNPDASVGRTNPDASVGRMSILLCGPQGIFTHVLSKVNSYLSIFTVHHFLLNGKYEEKTKSDGGRSSVPFRSI